MQVHFSSPVTFGANRARNAVLLGTALLGASILAIPKLPTPTKKTGSHPTISAHKSPVQNRKLAVPASGSSPLPKNDAIAYESIPEKLKLTSNQKEWLSRIQKSSYLDVDFTDKKFKWIKQGERIYEFMTEGYEKVGRLVVDEDGTLVLTYAFFFTNSLARETHRYYMPPYSEYCRRSVYNDAEPELNTQEAFNPKTRTWHTVR